LSCSDKKTETSTPDTKAENSTTEWKPPSATAQYVPEGGRARFEGKGYTEQQIDDLLAVEAVMTEALVRWSYRDKSVLYENEFESVRAKFSLEEYLNSYRIKTANGADTVVGYYVTGGTFYERDSVIVDDVVVFIGPTDKRTDFVNKDLLFYRQGRWIHPMISTMRDQLEYEQLIRQADSAAAAEGN
jgi:hypothetical protein